MAIDLTEAARSWAVEHPHVVEATTALEQRGVRTALFSSAAHEIVRRGLNLPSIRRPGDVDLLVVHGQLQDTSGILGETLRLRMMRTRSSDGHTLRFIGHELLTQRGADSIQAIDPYTRLRADNLSYSTWYTEHAAAARTVVETNEGLLPLAHLADTVFMYSILQRGGEKADLHNTAQLLRMGEPLADPYVAERAAAVGIDTRAWEFIRQAGQLAAHSLTLAA